MSASFQDQI